jgi:predicted NUDIX family NTP pyrophosphohydrolase
MPRVSAGVIMYRKAAQGLEVLLAHPGGPFWRHKDLGAWSIPKGELEPGEAEEAAARREFFEETGLRAGDQLVYLGEVKQKGGKIVKAWAFEGDCDPTQCPKSWEVDRVEFFGVETAKTKINAAQAALLQRLEQLVK